MSERERSTSTLDPESAAAQARARLLRSRAGPALIVAAVVFGLRGFVFRDFLTDQHPDILAFWLPRWSFLGHSLRVGHVPLWNPLQFAGVPFASDPQSGWLNVPAMALFWRLSGGAALRAYIVLQPLLAGLGLWWFLRREGLGRIAATAGGLSLAMLISASNVAVSLPFVAMLAWTPFALVGASGYLGAATLPARLGWLALAAFAWGQVGAAHMSHGLAMATLTVALYLVARTVRETRAGRLRPWAAAGLVVGFAAFLVLANLAVFLPRISLLPHTSLREGYGAIGGAAARVAGLRQRPLAPTGFWSGWPLSLGVAPGAYAGAVILFAVPAALRTRSKRYLAAAFAAIGGIAWLLTLNALVDTSWFRHFVLNLPFGDVYLHNPGRLRYLMLLVVPVLGAIGIQGLMERQLGLQRAVAWIGAGAALWLVLPLLIGARPDRFVLLAIATVAAVPALVWLGRDRRWAGVVLVGVLAVELAGSAGWSQAYEGGTVFTGLEPDRSGKNLIPQPLRWPDVSVDAYTASGPIVRAMKEAPARYLTWDPPEVFIDKGYLYEQGPSTWPALENARGMLFGLQDSMGYSPIQLTRYWTYIRATNRQPVFYNAAVLHHPKPIDLWLLGVRYLIVPAGFSAPERASPDIMWQSYVLYDVPEATTTGPVTLLPRWQVADSGTDALRSVLQRGFDPDRLAVLQRAPGLQPGRTGTSRLVSYRRTAPEDVRIKVETTSPAVLLWHESFDSDWSASVDGGPFHQVLAADYFLQGVPVPAGRHTIELRYTDPTTGRGLLASAVVWGVFALVLGASLIARRRRYSAG